jgi:hypothetical protein
MRSAVTAYAVRFALVAGLLLSWALAIGRYGGPDEPAHVLRSFAAAHGDVLGDPADPLPPGYRTVSVPAGLATGDPTCYRHDARLDSSCAASDPAAVGAADADTRIRAATSAGLTPPLYHLAVGGIVRLIGDPADSAWYRAAAALLHAAVLALILTRVRARPAHAVLVAAVVTPATWFLFGVVNPNSLEIALTLLCWVGVARLVASPSPKAAEAWWIAAPAAAAIVIRPIAVVPVAAMLIVIELRSRPQGLSRRRRAVLLSPLGAAVAAVVIWSAAVSIQVDDERTAVHRSVLSNLRSALRSLPTSAGEAVTSLGWNEFHPPLLVSLLWTLAWLLTVVVVRLRPSRDLMLWLLIVWATPVLFEVVLAGSIGPIWQGRYSLPMVMALPAFVMLTDPRAASRLVRPMVVVVALVETVTYWATVRRYAVGSRGSWLLTDAVRSSVAVGPRAWVVVHLVLVGVMSGTLWRSASAAARPPTGQAM